MKELTLILIIAYIIAFIYTGGEPWVIMLGLRVLKWLDIACISFFAISFLFLLFTKKRKATISYVDDENGIDFIVYKVEDKEIRNLFPTDGLTKKIFYKKEMTSVRVLKLLKKEYTFDNISIFIIISGLILFSLVEIMIDAAMYL